MSKNVLIPRDYLWKIVDLLECTDISSHPNYYDYLEILRGLKMKMRKLEIRDTYAKIIQAGDPDSMHNARIEYLCQKRHIADIDLAGFDS